jgi:aspartate aminotransferase-like enzyme
MRGLVKLFNEKMDLRLPGPVQVPREIQRAMLQSFDHPMMDYRTEHFQTIMKETTTKAKMIFQTEDEVIPLTSSGASALETAIINLIGPDDTIIICVIGYFGEYLLGITDHIGCKVVKVEAEWGDVIDPENVRKTLKEHPEVKAVFATHCETSTGAINPIKEIATIVSETDAVFLVDAVSSIVGTPLYKDEWGIDIVATGGQKALMLPPGLALVTVSEKAWAMMEKHKCPSFYFDLKKYRKTLPEATPYTPNIALVCGLLESINMIERGGGIESEYKRHSALKEMTRTGVKALGLELFVKDDAASPTLTSVVIDHIDADQFRKFLRDELHVALGGGLGKVKGKIVRLGHMGYTDASDLLKMFGVFEVALKKTGFNVQLGSGVAAAQDYWLENPNC